MIKIGISTCRIIRKTEQSFQATYIKVKFSRYRTGVAERVGRSISLLFYDCGTIRG